MPEIIDPVFAKTSQNARFLSSENERFGLVFVKTGSINSGNTVLSHWTWDNTFKALFGPNMETGNVTQIYEQVPYRWIKCQNISLETHIGLRVSDQEVPVLAALRHECVTVAAADLAVVPALTSYLLTHRLVPEHKREKSVS
jgi:hypothetical protein